MLRLRVAGILSLPELLPADISTVVANGTPIAGLS
jgi:hypothetical protein